MTTHEKKKKTKKVTYPIHKMGKHCGYDEYEDGSIKVAAYHYDQMTAALTSEVAVNTLLQSVTEQCHKLFIPIIEAQRRFWDAVKVDYSLDYEKYEYFYDDKSKILTRKEKVEEK